MFVVSLPNDTTSAVMSRTALGKENKLTIGISRWYQCLNHLEGPMIAPRSPQGGRRNINPYRHVLQRRGRVQQPAVDSAKRSIVIFFRV